MVQNVIVLLIVLAAIFFVGRRYYKAWNRRDAGCGCSPRDGCASCVPMEGKTACDQTGEDWNQKTADGRRKMEPPSP